MRPAHRRREVGKHRAQAVGGLDHALDGLFRFRACDFHVEADLLPADGDIRGQAHLPPGVVLAGHLDLDPVDRDVQAGAPHAVPHRQAGAQTGPHQLPRMRPGAAAPLGSGLVDAHGAILVFDVASQAFTEPNSRLPVPTGEGGAAGHRAGLATIKFLDFSRVHGAVPTGPEQLATGGAETCAGAGAGSSTQPSIFRGRWRGAISAVRAAEIEEARRVVVAAEVAPSAPARVRTAIRVLNVPLSISSSLCLRRVGEDGLCPFEPFAGGFGNPPRVPILQRTRRDLRRNVVPSRFEVGRDVTNAPTGESGRSAGRGRTG